MPVSEPVIRPVLAFIAMVLGCGTVIAFTAALTEARIEENRARRVLDTLTELTGSPALATDVSWRDDVAFLCPDQALIRGAAPGYGGDIHWLGSADVSGGTPRLKVIRITAHQETPGIADFLNRPRQGWLGSLAGRGAAGIAQVDAVSGATITSRSLRRSLTSALARPALRQSECPP